MNKKSGALRIIGWGLLRWIAVAICFGAAVFIFTINSRRQAAIALLVTFFILIAVDVIYMLVMKKINAVRIMNTAFYRDDSGAGLATVKDFTLPLIFFGQGGEVLWTNKAFKDLFVTGEGTKFSIRKTAFELYTSKIHERVICGDADFTFDAAFAGRNFIVNGTVLESGVMAYCADITELWRSRKKAEDSALAVGLIALDSYEEIYQSDGENVVNMVSGELGKMLESWITGNHAVVKKLVRDRYIILIEKQYLSSLKKDRFSILDKAKNISVGNHSLVTLSMGISNDKDTIKENYENAEDACRLAMERGGDQAVVRENGKDTYYGGSNNEIERRSKIKAKAAAATLKDEIEKSDRILIMGHGNCDMDSLGAALSVYRLCCISNRDAKIILNKPNKSIEYAVRHLYDIGYEDVFVSTADALGIMDDRTLTVVLDTYKQSQTEAPKVLDNASKVIVIDHHRRGADYIKDTIMFYSETYASSTCELMVEILNYYANNVTLKKVEAEAMYAGICVDTKSFNFKTGIRTFEAASFLRSQGVDPVEVKKYFQPDYETYSMVSKIISSAELVNGNVAIAFCEKDIPNSQFISALAADRLLTISEIEASFVLSQNKNDVSISGRSLGNINVQVILEKFGGGGHFTSAGAQVKDTTIDETELKLKEAIAEVTK